MFVKVSTTLYWYFVKASFWFSFSIQSLHPASVLVFRINFKSTFAALVFFFFLLFASFSHSMVNILCTGRYNPWSSKARGHRTDYVFWWWILSPSKKHISLQNGWKRKTERVQGGCQYVDSNTQDMKGIPKKYRCCSTCKNSLDWLKSPKDFWVNDWLQSN